MSQDSLAKAVGVTRQTIIAIEKGRFVPSTLLALKLARFFGRPVEQVFRIEEGGFEAPENESSPAPPEGEQQHAIGN